MTKYFRPYDRFVFLSNIFGCWCEGAGCWCYGWGLSRATNSLLLLLVMMSMFYSFIIISLMKHI